MDIKIKGLDDVTRNLDSFSQDVQVELKEALDISLRDVQEYAREHHRFITRTGEAERSIETAASYGTYFKGVVGTTREITVYLHTETDRHVIVPRLKQSLRFVKGDKFKFARRHPGNENYINSAFLLKRYTLMNTIKDYLNTPYETKLNAIGISYFICEMKKTAKIISNNININEGNNTKMENELKEILQKIELQTEKLNEEMNLWLEKSLEIRKFIDEADYLSDKQKQILSLRYLSFKTWEEIAVIMDLSYQWVHKLHERALIKIAERM